ncbi:MAG TPA: thiamine biosynthesis protein [Acidimicrobiaceae bacterium]|nr:thiamine biosynthesis protein [Acidimicrobiaceae bacterium]
MGTTVSIDLVDSHDRALVDRLVQWFHHVEDVFSPYRGNSVVTRIGQGECIADDLSDEVLEVLGRCESLCVQTGGVFDVWNLPSPNGTRFDPCGYVKGWSVQRAADMLLTEGVRDFCLNAGGDVAVGGRNHDGDEWRVGVRHPHHPGCVALVLHGEGPLAVATSGTYERGAHITDPRSGDAVTHVASATVVGPDLAEADAYATTVFAMGVDGLDWLADQLGYDGAVITHDGRLRSTPGLAAYR